MSKQSFILCSVLSAASLCAQTQRQPTELDMPEMDIAGRQSPTAKARPKPQPNRANQPSEQDSLHQPSNNKLHASGDATSITLPVQEMQEPEAEDFRTGGDLPAPELLKEVVSRRPMALEMFLGLADKENPTLKQAQRYVERSNEQARQVSLPPNPIIGYSGDHIRGGSYQGGEQGAFFSQVFVLGRKLALRRDIYRAEGRSNQFAAEVQRARVRDDVAHAFFHTLSEQASVVIHDRLLKVALDAQTNAHELQRVGQVDASDVLSAEIGAEQAKVDFETAQRMFLASFAELATYAGQKSLSPSPLTGKLVEPPRLNVEEMVAANTEDSPLVKKAHADVALAEARIKNAKRERVPNLDVKAGEWYSGESLGATGLKAGWESFAEVGVQLPLWNHNQGNVQAAKIELDRAHQEVARTQLWTKNQAEPYAQQYLVSRSTADRYRKEMLPRARRAYELQVTKYQQMALAYPNVLTAQARLFTLQLAYIQALDQEWKAALALQNYTLMNGLEYPLSVGDDSTTLNLPTGGNQ